MSPLPHVEAILKAATDNVAATSSPVERARAAAELIDALAIAQGEASRLRLEALVELRANDVPVNEIARRVGLTHPRVSQLLKRAAQRESGPTHTAV